MAFTYADICSSYRHTRCRLQRGQVLLPPKTESDRQHKSSYMHGTRCSSSTICITIVSFLMNPGHVPLSISLFSVVPKDAIAHSLPAIYNQKETALVFLLNLRNHYLFVSHKESTFSLCALVFLHAWHDVWRHSPYITAFHCEACLFNHCIQCFEYVSLSFPPLALHYFVIIPQDMSFENLFLSSVMRIT